MKKFLKHLTIIYPAKSRFDWGLLLFRILISLELMMAHGLKKLGVGVAEAEDIPNPLHLPDFFNHSFAIAANLFFPILVILGLFTRIAVLPILAVTLTGYFVLHWHDSLLIKDTPFIYSVAYVFLFVIGPGKFSADYLIQKRLEC